MAHVPEVQAVEVYSFQDAGGARLLVHASGEVEGAGWSRLRLSPRFEAAPPAGGLWEFDFEGDPPGGPVVDVVLGVVATAVVAAPDWLQGVKVYAARGSALVSAFQAAALIRHPVPAPSFMQGQGSPRYRQDLVGLEDGFSIIGPGGHAGSLRMKKLRHALTLTVEGPADTRVCRCVSEAAGLGLTAAIAAAYASGGGALSSAVAALLSHLQEALGHAYSPRVDERADWIEWCT